MKKIVNGRKENPGSPEECLVVLIQPSPHPPVVSSRGSSYLGAPLLLPLSGSLSLGLSPHFSASRQR